MSLPEDKEVALAGRWTQRDPLWNDTSLVFAVEGRRLCVLDGGAAESVLLWKNDEKFGAYLCDMAWSADESKLYLWLDLEQQLCAMDARTGEFDSLLQLDSHIWHYEGMRHLDPQPKFRPAGVLEDAERHRLLLLLYEEPNEAVAFWQRRSGRGGAQIVAVSLADHSFKPLFDKSLMHGSIVSWDLSLDREMLYSVSLAPDVHEYSPDQQRVIGARRLNGAPLWRIEDTPGRADGVQLSPDGKWLLVTRSYRPDFVIPAGKKLNREQLNAVVENQWGGFLIIDPESGSGFDGPRSGQQARWAPDSDRVAYVDGWSVKVCSLRDRSITPLIVGGPDDWAYGTWIEPVWSDDGKRLAVTGRAVDTTLLLDLDLNEYVVLHDDISDKVWGRNPKPFPDDKARR